VVGTTLILAMAGLLFPLWTAEAAAQPIGELTGGSTCQPAGTTGLTAAVIAVSHEVIQGTINAQGCDVGVFVGHGVTDVVITDAKVVNANDHGIFVKDTWGVTIRGNIVVHNGLAPHTCGTAPCILEDKAIQLSGTHGVVVTHNVVKGNLADGGIGVSDDGPIDPAALAPGLLRAGTGNVIADNQIIDDAAGCGIVVAAYNAGAGVSDNTVRDNLVVGSAPGTGPFVGGIVVAADAPGTWVWGNLVAHNEIFRSLIPGIVVHSNAPGDKVWNNTLQSNKISNSGFEGPPNDPTVPTGIEVVAEAAPGEPNAPTLANTTVSFDTINHNAIGVWLCDETNTQIVDLDGHASVSVESC
jgi:Right handed beta helix region